MGAWGSFTMIRRFHLEAEAAAQLDHPGIVPVFEVGEHAGQPYLAMAYVEGQSLWQRVKVSPLDPHEAAGIMQQVAEAVHHAHERGIIHRDLKPQNILITTGGLPRVTDFGLAKRSESDSSLTATGQVMGTPSYMPPEQASGRTDKLDKRADVYSLGATLYCLLTGRPPFQAANAMDTLLQVIQQEPVAPRQFNPNIPRDLETIVLKCLAKSPDRRYQTALEVADDLARWLRNEPIRARPTGRVERTFKWTRRHPATASLIATVSIAFSILLLTGAWYNRRLDYSRRVAERGASNARLSQVQSAIEKRPTEAASLLHDDTQFPREHRDLTWRLLDDRLQRKLMVLRSHQDVVIDTAFSPDSTQLASMDASGTALLWDTGTGSLTQTVCASSLGITAYELIRRKNLGGTVENSDWAGLLGFGRLRFSHDGRYLAVHTRPKNEYLDREIQKAPLRLIRLPDGEMMWQSPDVDRFVFDPKRPRIAAVTGSTLTIRSLDQQQETLIEIPGDGGVWDLKFAADGSRILCLTESGTIVQIAADGDSQPRTTGRIALSNFVMADINEHQEQVAVLAMRPVPAKKSHDKEKSEWFLQIVDLNGILITDRRLGNATPNLINPGIALRWLPDGTSLLAAAEETDAVFSCVAGKIAVRLENLTDDSQATTAPGGGPLAVAFSPKINPRKIVQLRVLEGDGQVTLDDHYESDRCGRELDLATRKGVTTINAGLIDPVIMFASLSMSPDAQMIAIGAGSRDVRLWQLRTTDCQWTSQLSDSPFVHLQFSSDETRLLEVRADGSVVLRNAVSGKSLETGKLPVSVEKFRVRAADNLGRLLVFPLIPEFSVGQELFFDEKDQFVWDIGRNEVVLSKELPELKSWGRSPSDQSFFLSTDGRFFINTASGYQKRAVIVTEIDSGSQHELKLDGFGNGAVASGLDELTTSAHSSEYGGSVSVQVWQLTSGKLLKSKTTFLMDASLKGLVNGMAIFEDDKTHERIWYDVESNRTVWRGLVQAPDRRHAARLDDAGNLHFFYDGSEASRLALFDVSNFQWTSDGETLITLHNSGQLRLRDGRSGAERAAFSLPAGSPTFWSISPSGQYIAVGDQAGTLTVFAAPRSE